MTDSLFADLVGHAAGLMEEHGVPGLVNLFGMESPGLTACLAIGAYVRDRYQLTPS